MHPPTHFDMYLIVTYENLISKKWNWKRQILTRLFEEIKFRDAFEILAHAIKQIKSHNHTHT